MRPAPEQDGGQRVEGGLAPLGGEYLAIAGGRREAALVAGHGDPSGARQAQRELGGRDLLDDHRLRLLRDRDRGRGGTQVTEASGERRELEALEEVAQRTGALGVEDELRDVDQVEIHRSVADDHRQVAGE